MPHHVAIALGGNQGEVLRNFREAAALLGANGLRSVRLAEPIRTAPVDCVPGTPDFWNAALIGEWDGTPEELLALTQSIERRLGRPAAHSSRESRPIDLDILLFDEAVVSLPNLVIPHPRLRLRRFVLEPLAEIAPDWLVPPDRTAVAALLNALPPSKELSHGLE